MLAQMSSLTLDALPLILAALGLIGFALRRPKALN